MKLLEVLNNGMWINVAPCPSKNKSIAAVKRAKADKQGNVERPYKDIAQPSKAWPNDKYDRRQYDDVSAAIAQRARKIAKKNNPSDDPFTTYT